MRFIVYAIIPFVVAAVLPITSAVLHKNIVKKEKKLSKKGFSMRASKSFYITLIIFTCIFPFLIALLTCMNTMFVYAPYNGSHHANVKQKLKVFKTFFQSLTFCYFKAKEKNCMNLLRGLITA